MNHIIVHDYNTSGYFNIISAKIPGAKIGEKVIVLEVCDEPPFAYIGGNSR